MNSRDSFPSRTEFELKRKATRDMISVIAKIKPKVSKIRTSASMGSGNSFLFIVLICLLPNINRILHNHLQFNSYLIVSYMMMLAAIDRFSESTLPIAGIYNLISASLIILLDNPSASDPKSNIFFDPMRHLLIGVSPETTVAMNVNFFLLNTSFNKRYLISV